MKKIVLTVLAVALGAAAFSPAEARSSRAAAASHERMMAFYADPSGTYAGYPDWARAAFGGGEGNNGV